jgi:hypothetical protein
MKTGLATGRGLGVHPIYIEGASRSNPTSAVRQAPTACQALRKKLFLREAASIPPDEGTQAFLNRKGMSASG